MSVEDIHDSEHQAITTERARLFALLGRLLVAAPDALLLDALSGLNGDRSALGGAYGELAAAATVADSVSTEREFHDLFIGLGGGRPHRGQWNGAERRKPDARHPRLLQEGAAIEPAGGQPSIGRGETLPAGACFRTLDQHEASLPGLVQLP